MEIINHFKTKNKFLQKYAKSSTFGRDSVLL